jgi:hypothetical protein
VKQRKNLLFCLLEQFPDGRGPVSFTPVGGFAFSCAHHITCRNERGIASEIIYTNRAHALMFLGRVEEARALYLQYRGRKNVLGEKPWDAIVLEDFAELRQAGLTHPLMDEIEKAFTAGG